MSQFSFAGLEHERPQARAEFKPSERREEIVTGIGLREMDAELDACPKSKGIDRMRQAA